MSFEPGEGAEPGEIYRVSPETSQSDVIAVDEMSKATFDCRTEGIPPRSVNSRRLYVLYLLFGCCTLFYYFGELVGFAGWEALRWDFLYGVHDVQRLLFLAPIIYAGYFFGVRAAVIITLVAIMTFLPRALFISPFPDPLLRTVLFIIVAGTMGYLTAKAHSESERCQRLEAVIESERDKLLSIVDGMADGVLITGPDYRIRFMNSNMVKDLGEGTGLPCYQHLRHLDAPCEQGCKIPDVINNNEIGKWECAFPHGRTYEVMAAPYIDSDGVVCQLSIFRNIAQRKKV